MSSYNCPKCNAMIEIPEAGKVMICKYCGARARKRLLGFSNEFVCVFDN